MTGLRDDSSNSWHITLLHQYLQQCLGRLAVGGVQPFRKPAVDGGQ
jgi:hypothetical protein